MHRVIRQQPHGVQHHAQFLEAGATLHPESCDPLRGPRDQRRMLVLGHQQHNRQRVAEVQRRQIGRLADSRWPSTAAALCDQRPCGPSRAALRRASRRFCCSSATATPDRLASRDLSGAPGHPRASARAGGSAPCRDDGAPSPAQAPRPSPDPPIPAAPWTPKRPSRAPPPRSRHSQPRELRWQQTTYGRARPRRPARSGPGSAH